MGLNTTQQLIIHEIRLGNNGINNTESNLPSIKCKDVKGNARSLTIYWIMFLLCSLSNQAKVSTIMCYEPMYTDIITNCTVFELCMHDILSIDYVMYTNAHKALMHKEEYRKCFFRYPSFITSVLYFVFA